MKIILSIASITLIAGLFMPAAHAQAVARPRSAQVITEQQETPYLGVGGMDITTERAKTLKLKDEHGFEVTVVYPDNAAAKAGLKDGDVVLEYNGQRVEGWEQFRRMVSETPIHREVKITISRNGAQQTLTAVMGSKKDGMFSFGSGGGFGTGTGGGFGGAFPTPDMTMPMPPMAPTAPDIPMFRSLLQNAALGINGEPLTQEPQLAEYFGVKQGVLVRSVMKNSAGDKGGIKAGDVITKIDDTPIAGTRDISMALRGEARTKHTCTVTVMRNHKETTLTVTLEGTVRGELMGPAHSVHVVL